MVYVYVSFVVVYRTWFIQLNHIECLLSAVKITRKWKVCLPVEPEALTEKRYVIVKRCL